MSQSQSMCLNPVAKAVGYVLTQMSHFVASLPLGLLREPEKERPRALIVNINGHVFEAQGGNNYDGV